MRFSMWGSDFSIGATLAKRRSLLCVRYETAKVSDFLIDNKLSLIEKVNVGADFAGTHCLVVGQRSRTVIK